MTSLDPTTHKNVTEWLEGPFDQKTKDEIKRLLETNPQAIIDAFYTNLSFGTAGMRGLMGIGTNRLNQYTIRFATQGLANYIIKQKLGNTTHKVVIGYDSRHHSREFAQEAASVLAANGIEVFLTSDLRPTPFVSFVCRLKKATAAIMITASHNPAEYNGYKVYWSDGAQVLPPHDIGIIEEVNKIHNLSQVKTVKSNNPLIHLLGKEDDEAYLNILVPLQYFPEQNKKSGKDLHILFSNLHGTGITLLPQALSMWGFTQLSYVEEQKKPNGDFPTIPKPNPEEIEALQLGIDTLIHINADIFIANDPDADRLGLVAMHQKKPFVFDGNQIAAICAYHLCQHLPKIQKEKPAIITSIVTTELLKEIAHSFHVDFYEVLTGFKYIGEKIHEWETSSKGRSFLFGAEESHGYLIGTYARDKDAIVMACLISEIALHAKKAGKTLVALLYEIYQKYGVYQEKQIPVAFKPGAETTKKIDALMTQLRKNPPYDICGKEIIIVEDYLSHTWNNLKTKEKGSLFLPKSNVLVFRLIDKSRLTIRPSGTEPKIKIYGTVSQKEFSSIEDGIKECQRKLDRYLNEIKTKHLTL